MLISKKEHNNMNEVMKCCMCSHMYFIRRANKSVRRLAQELRMTQEDEHGSNYSLTNYYLLRT